MNGQDYSKFLFDSVKRRKTSQLCIRYINRNAESRFDHLFPPFSIHFLVPSQNPSMGLNLHILVGAIKDTTSLTKAALTSPSSAAASAHRAVLRATSHLPATSPPSPHHLSALLSFGRSSRLTASSLVSALSSRLLSTHNPSVALKSLLCLHLLFSHGSFILKDQVFPALLRHPASGRNPLALSSFRSSISYSLSAWVRWFARVLELMLLAPSDNPDLLTVLQNHDVISELESLVAVVEEISRVPEGPASTEGNRLVSEVVRQAEEDWVRVRGEISVRVRELSERVGLLTYSDLVELLCVLKRIEVATSQPSDWEWMAWDDEGLVSEVGRLKGKVEELVVRTEKQLERRVRRDNTSESARVFNPVRSELVQPVRFGSSRWIST